MNVRDSDGRFVTGMDPSSFRAILRHQPVKLLTTTRESAPYRIVLLLDSSASISQSKYTWELLQKVAGDFLSNPPTNSKVAMAFFSSNIKLSLDFSHSPSEMLGQLRASSDARKIAPNGERQTALFDSVLGALSMLGSPAPGDAVFAITDGRDSASKTSQEDLQRTLQARGVRFFAFYLTQMNLPLRDGIPGSKVLRELAVGSGGALLDIPDENGTTILYDPSPKGQEAMRTQLAYLYDLMSQYYSLQMELPVALAKTTRWDLNVVGNHGKVRRDVEEFYPRELASCSMIAASK